MSHKAILQREDQHKQTDPQLGSLGKRTLSPPPFQLTAPGEKDASKGEVPKKGGTPEGSASKAVTSEGATPEKGLPTNNPKRTVPPHVRNGSPQMKEYAALYAEMLDWNEKQEWNKQHLKSYKALMGSPRFFTKAQEAAYYKKIGDVADEQEALQAKVVERTQLLRTKMPFIPEYQESRLGIALRARAQKLRAEVGGMKMPVAEGKAEPAVDEKADALREELAQVEADLSALESSKGQPDKVLSLWHKYNPKGEDRKVEMDLDKKAGYSNGAISGQTGRRTVEKSEDQLITEDELTVSIVGVDKASRVDRSRFEVKKDQNTFSIQTDEKAELNWWDRSFSSSTTTAETLEEPGGKKKVDTHSDFKKVDGSGFSWGRTDTHTDNQNPSSERFKSSAVTKKAERGDGKLGFRRTREDQAGSLKPDGTMGDGLATHSNYGGGALLGPDGVGAYGDAEKGFRHQREDGSSVGARATFGGKMLVSVKDLGGNPKQYAIVIQISSQAGVFANYGKAGGAARLSAEGGLKAANAYTITKILSEDEKNAYLKSVDMAEKGKTTPSHPELGVITTIGRNSGKVTDAMLDQFKADKGLAERAKAMKNGESVDLDEDKSAELGATLGNGTFGVNYKATGGRNKKTNLLIVGDNAVLTVSINSRKGHTAGASVTMEGVKGKAQFGSEESEGKIVRITIPKDDPMLEKIAMELQGATHEHELMAIAAKYPQINIVTGNMKGRKDTEAAGLEIPILGAGFSASGEYREKEFSDGSAEYYGANNVGGNLSVMGVAMKSNSKEELEAKVDAKGNVDMDLKETDSEFDLDKTIDQLGKNIKNDPIGLLTGGARTMQESVDNSGTFLTNKEVDYLIHLANSKEYDNYINSPTLRIEWAKTVRKIRAAGNDRKAASKALAEFVGKARHGKKEALESMLESAGHRNGGARYEFPEGTAGLKGDYKWLLRGRPLAQIQGLLHQKKSADALQLAKDVLAKIALVKGGLEAKADAFEDKSRLADMLTFLSSLKAQVSALNMQMLNPKAKVADVAQNAEKTLFDEALSRCKTYKGQEANFYTRVISMMKDGYVSSSETIERAEILKQLDDLYLRWDDDHAQIKYLHGKYGFGGAELDLDGLSPNRKKLELTRAGDAPVVLDSAMSDTVGKGVRAAINKVEADNARLAAAVAAKAAAKARQERKAAAQRWIGQVKSKQAAVSEAMGMCNGMNRRKQTALIRPSANRSWNKAWSANARGGKALQTLQAIALNGSIEQIEKAGKDALDLFQQALAAFERGNQIQKYGG